MIDLERMSVPGSLARQPGRQPLAVLFAAAAVLVPAGLLLPMLRSTYFGGTDAWYSILGFALATDGAGSFFMAWCLILFAAVFPGWVIYGLFRQVFRVRSPAADDLAEFARNRLKWLATAAALTLLLVAAALTSGMTAGIAMLSAGVYVAGLLALSGALGLLAAARAAASSAAQ